MNADDELHLDQGGKSIWNRASKAPQQWVNTVDARGDWYQTALP